MDFFTRFTREKIPQNNFSSQNFSVENNYFCTVYFSHKEDMLADPQSVHAIQGIYRMVTDYIGMKNMPLNFDEFADIYGKMAINGFEICDEMGQNRYVCNL